MDPKFFNLSLQCLVIACCLIVAQEASARTHHANQSPRTNSPNDKLENFSTADGILVLLPPGVNFTDSQTKNRTIKLSADTFFNQDSRMDYYRASNELADIETRGGARESRKVNLLRSLWSRPKISPLYLVNGTVCRFVNSAPICTTLTTTGIMPTATSLALGRSGGFNSDVQFPGMNQQQQFQNQQQQFPTNQQQQQQIPQTQQQQFPNNPQQQFSNNPQQGTNQQQSRPSIG